MSREKLKTCPACGKGGFINLKAHVCKAITPAAKSRAPKIEKPKESIEQIEQKLSPVVNLIERKTVDLLYDVVSAGLWLIKAQAVHRCATVAHRSDGTFADSADGGFSVWLEEKYPRVSRRSAYNYIAAAQNCGLTIKDDQSAVDDLRKAKFLEGKTAGDLYRLKDKDQDQEQDDGGTTWNLIRDTAVSLREQCESVLAIRDQLNKKAFSTVCARLHRTLEELTGTPWDMVKQRKAEPFKEHGDVYDLGS